MEFKVYRASDGIRNEPLEVAEVKNIKDLYMLAVKYGNTECPGDGHDKEIPDLIISFTDYYGKENREITIYNDFVE